MICRSIKKVRVHLPFNVSHTLLYQPLSLSLFSSACRNSFKINTIWLINCLMYVNIVSMTVFNHNSNENHFAFKSGANWRWAWISLAKWINFVIWLNNERSMLNMNKTLSVYSSSIELKINLHTHCRKWFRCHF